MKELIKRIVGEDRIGRLKFLFRSSPKEDETLIQKRRDFYSQFLTSKDDIYFDVGANYGNRIEPIINKDIKIIAIEPQRKCIKALKKKFGDKIIIVSKGLGSTEEIKTMYIANSHTLSSFSKEWIEATRESGRFSQYKWNRKQKVQMTTMDALIELYGKPKFIKIDVEGFELQVLQGLSQPIEFLSFEYTVPERKKTVLECLDRIINIAGNNEVLFNYSVGESMVWKLEKWLTPEEMKKEIESTRFLETYFGDIYSKISTIDDSNESKIK